MCYDVDMSKRRFDKHIHLAKIRPFRETRNGEPAYDVQKIGTQIEGDRFYFVLNGFDDSGIQYFDSASGHNIQSIGHRKEDGAIIASLLPDMYGHPDYECIWLC